MCAFSLFIVNTYIHLNLYYSVLQTIYWMFMYCFLMLNKGRAYIYLTSLKKLFYPTKTQKDI